tara:strand:- start:461 stop:1309 length:849 start_codon:yes stop_codon:yes gene_type:complete
MSHKIVNDEQFEFWNEGIGQWWVDEDESMNERLSILTEELFLKSNIKKDDKVLDIGCGGGQTTFEVSEMVGENGYVLGADISKILLDLAKSKYASTKNLEFKYCDVQNYKFRENSFNKVISRFGVMFFENPIEAFKNIYNAIQEGGSLNFVCWTNVMENEFFTDPTNIIIRHLNKDFPEITRSPGPLAFSEEKYINEILSNSGFKNIKVEKVYSLITTNDSPEKNGELLLNIGSGGRLLADANLSKKELSVIRDEMVEISQKRQKNGKITYKACLNYVSATK